MQIQQEAELRERERTRKREADGSDVMVQVRDNGKGIPEEKQRELTASGLEFGGMRERVLLLGGALEIQSDGTGTLVRATLKVA